MNTTQYVGKNLFFSTLFNMKEKKNDAHFLRFMNWWREKWASICFKWFRRFSLENMRVLAQNWFQKFFLHQIHANVLFFLSFLLYCFLFPFRFVHPTSSVKWCYAIQHFSLSPSILYRAKAKAKAIKYLHLMAVTHSNWNRFLFHNSNFFRFAFLT